MINLSYKVNELNSCSETLIIIIANNCFVYLTFADPHYNSHLTITLS